MKFMDYDKVPPQSTDLEEIILGSLMVEPDLMYKIIKYYTPDVFYLEAHKEIYKAIESLFKAEEPIDLATVTRRIKENGKLEDVGGAYYMAQLLKRIAGTGNFEYHSRIVFQDYIRRQAIKASSEITKNSFDISVDVFDLISMFNDAYLELSNSIDIPEIKASDMIDSFVDHVASNTPPSSAIFINRSIGIPELDKVVRWAPNKLMVMAGSSKDGKTKLASFIVWQLLRSDKEASVLWVTLEDTPQDILTSFCSSVAKVKPKAIMERNTNDQQRFKILEATDEFRNWDIDFVSTSVSVKDIATRMDVFVNKRPNRFNILVIDNLMSLADKYHFARNPNAFYDTVYGVVADIRRNTNAFILMLHHFKDEYNEDSNIETGFRPKITDAKGSEANHRVPNYLFLINNPSKKKALLNKYSGKKKEILERLMILDPVVLRDESNTGDKSLIRLYSNLDFNIFKGL